MEGTFLNTCINMFSTSTSFVGFFCFFLNFYDSKKLRKLILNFGKHREKNMKSVSIGFRCFRINFLSNQFRLSTGKGSGINDLPIAF